MNRILIFLLILGLGASACKKEVYLSPAEQAEVDRGLIEQYVADNGLTTQVDPYGIHYVIEVEGTGSNPLTTDKVEVRYKGSFLDGSVFDQSPGTETISFGLNQVIPGWTVGIPLFKEGGKGILIIPSALAYGPAGRRPSIPPNEVLVFEVELVRIVPQ